MRLFVAKSRAVHRRRSKILAAAAFVALLSGSTGAIAQILSPPPAPTPNCTSTQTGPVNNLNQLALPSSAVAGALAGAIGNINTIFLRQQRREIGPDSATP